MYFCIYIHTYIYMNVTIIKEKEGINLRLAGWGEVRGGLERGYLREAVGKKMM